jgi:hypothetical protein
MTRVVVGTCEHCGRELRVVDHGVRESMHLTCRCGARNLIRPSPELVERASKLAAELNAIKQQEAMERRQEEMRREAERRLALELRAEAEREQRKQAWSLQNALISDTLGVTNFLAWRIARGGIWGPVHDPRDHPPIFPERIARRHARGEDMAFREYQLQYDDVAAEIRHFRTGFTFLVRDGDVKGLEEGIEATISEDPGFYNLATRGALGALEYPPYRREAPVEREHAAHVRRLCRLLAQHFAAVLWPDQFSEPWR